jgi:hypothetical protein
MTDQASPAGDGAPPPVVPDAGAPPPVAPADGRVHVVVHRPPATGMVARIPWLQAFQVGSIVALIGLALSAFALWHQSSYVPSTLPAELSVSVDLTQPAAVPSSVGLGDIKQFEAVIHVKNEGSRRVTVLAGQYQMWGSKLTQRPPSDADSWVTREQALCGSPFGDRYVTPRGGSDLLLASGRVFDAIWLDAGQEADERVLLFARPPEVDVAQFFVNLSVAKGEVIQTDERPTSWTSTELNANTANWCQEDVAGDLTVPPIYWTYWRVENRTPLINMFVHDERAIAVEWRPARWSGRGQSTGTECDPTQVTDASGSDPCVPTELIGSDRPGSFVDPTIAFCQKATDPTTCHLTSTLPLKTLFDLEHELGMSSSSASASVVLWDQPRTDGQVGTGGG